MEKILVIEDDESLSRGIQFALEKEGYQVIVATTLKDGYRLFQSGQFDLILLDVMLPDGSGFDFCKRVRSTSGIPIVFLTACDEEVNVVLGLEIGGDDYVTKPFRVRELTSRIKAVLRRKPGQVVTTSLQSGNIRLCLETREVYKQGEVLLITPAEFKLLSVFMQHPFQVLTRDNIVEKLWHAGGEYVDDNTLSVYIRRLREKIEDDPSNPDYIVTARGFGYKWNQGRG